MSYNKQTVSMRLARDIFRNPVKQVLRSYVFMQRNIKGINQADLAELVGVSRSTLQNIEHNRTCPSILTALRLSQVLQVPVEHLFEIKYDLPREVQNSPIGRRLHVA